VITAAVNAFATQWRVVCVMMLLLTLGTQVCVVPLLIVTIVFVDIKDTFTVMLSSGHTPFTPTHPCHTHTRAPTSSA
jgi:hypothetical protein